VANPALLAALRAKRMGQSLNKGFITGATDDVQPGQDMPMPQVRLGPLEIDGSSMMVSDLRIFELWKMTREPAILIGIDILGRLDILVIDYRRMELQVQTRPQTPGSIMTPSRQF
jgi:hypothetical protein